MTESALKRFAPYALALGLAGLLAAAVIWLLQRQFDTYVQASLAVGLLGLALAMLFNPAAVQTWLGGRQARYGGNVLVMVLALLGILIIANYLAVKNPKQWDWSEDRLNTLAPETINVLKELDQPVQAVAFYSPNFANAQSTARQLLEQYRTNSAGNFDYEFHDPLGEPTVAREYNITRDGTIIIEMGENREEISFATEDQITGALVRLANPTERSIYVLTGHGERDQTATDDAGLSKVADLLTKQNYVVQPLNLQVTTTVPADARALLIVGPVVPVTPEEVNLIKSYVDGGGSLLVLLDPVVQMQREPGTPDPLVDYLRQSWGVALADDVVVDLYNSYPNQPLFPLNAGYGSSPITARLQNISTVFPVARSVVIPGEGSTIPDYTYTPLVTAEGRAWGETNVDSLGSEGGPALDEGDTAPPVHLGVAVENAQTKARLVVFGDSDFAANGWTDQGANGNLFTNSLNWVTVEESLINLTPKVPTTRTLALVDALTVNLIFLITVVAMPLAVLVLGGVAWFQRRRHA